MLLETKLWISYFIIYSIIIYSIILRFKQRKISKIKQIFFPLNKTNKILIIIIFLSIRGLPPFSGFIAKYLIIINLTKSNNTIFMFPIILSTLIRLYFYLRIVVTRIILTNEKNYINKIQKNFNKKTTFINIFALVIG